LICHIPIQSNTTPHSGNPSEAEATVTNLEATNASGGVKTTEKHARVESDTKDEMENNPERPTQQKDNPGMKPAQKKRVKMSKMDDNKGVEEASDDELGKGLETFPSMVSLIILQHV
jgi:hypothetical protein